MPRRFDMMTLRTRCKQRCDKENDLSITDGEWDSLMSEAFGELWGVVAESGLRYWEASTTITANGAASYDEPDDILASIGVDFLVEGTPTGSRRSLDEIMVQERTRWSGQHGEARVYAQVDDQLFLFPTPANGTYEWLYIPQAPDLTTYGDAGIVDVVTPEGERFLIWATVVKALAKSESSVQLAMVERDSAREKVLEWAVLRAFNNPRRRYVRDSTALDDYGMPYDASDWWTR